MRRALRQAATTRRLEARVGGGESSAEMVAAISAAAGVDYSRATALAAPRPVGLVHVQVGFRTIGRYQASCVSPHHSRPVLAEPLGCAPNARSPPYRRSDARAFACRACRVQLVSWRRAYAYATRDALCHQPVRRAWSWRAGTDQMAKAPSRSRRVPSRVPFSSIRRVGVQMDDPLVLVIQVCRLARARTPQPHTLALSPSLALARVLTRRSALRRPACLPSTPSVSPRLPTAMNGLPTFAQPQRKRARHRRAGRAGVGAAAARRPAPVALAAGWAWCHARQLARGARRLRRRPRSRGRRGVCRLPPA